VRILFCGDTFPSAQQLLKQRLGLVSHQFKVCGEAEIRSAVAETDVVVPLMLRIDASLIESGAFRLIQQWGSGLEGVDLEAARRRGIWVANVPTLGCNADSVAEHNLLLILSLLRRVSDAHANLRKGIVGAPLGQMLGGRTVCLYGLGETALATARRLRACNVRLIGITRDPLAQKVASFDLDACYSTSERNVGLAQAHILVLCTRLSKETRGIIDAEALAALPAGAYLVNAARGGLVDYSALRDALSSGRLAGAGLDVYWQEPVAPNDPLLSLPNVIATPHIAGVTDRSYGEIADAVALNIHLLGQGEPPLNRVV
jgi:phosphoglycerate dehydrogenase-like enzyme